MDFYIGTILPWAVSYAPQDWRMCDGSRMSINQNQALYALIGVKYGGDPAQGYFNLPDLRGRVMVGANGTTHPNGQVGGSESTMLTSTNIPNHNHPLYANTNGAVQGTNIPSNNSLLSVATDSSKKPANVYTSTVTSTTLTAMNSASIGGNQSQAPAPVSVMQPFGVVNFIICVNGMFPANPN
ncbi:phage tail protein [Clostridium sp.]|uniref:phage tail protein n=1 Tax=Clostridium sp. TaxID=1506 RepID=UPI00262EA867|nr:tail fiber protein [Clostridium sp.]